MSAVEQLGRDAFLAGVDDLGVRRGGRDLGDVLRFDRVTEDDAGRGAPAASLTAGEWGWLGIT